MNDFRTPLSRVRGHGAAKEGVSHHIAHRVSAIILALILPFVVYGLMKALPNGYDGLTEWLSSGFGAFSVLIFITAALFHGRLGMNEVILDYVPNHGKRMFALLLNTLLSFGFWLVGVLAILKLWLGA